MSLPGFRIKRYRQLIDNKMAIISQRSIAILKYYPQWPLSITKLVRMFTNSRRYSWGDRAVKVQSLNTANHTVTLAEKTTYGLTLGKLDLKIVHKRQVFSYTYSNNITFDLADLQYNTNKNSKEVRKNGTP